MAITRDNSRDPQAYSGTFSYTTAGSNRLLLVGAYTGNGTSPTVTYNGVAMTIVSSAVYNGSGRLSLYALLNPAVGSNTIDCGSPIAYCGVASYNGVDLNQTIPEASGTTTGNTNTWTASLTSTATGGATMGFFVYDGGGTGSAGTDTTALNSWVGAVAIFMLESTSLNLGAGSHSLQVNATSSSNAGLVIASFNSADTSITSNLAAYWKLDESSGNASDSSGNANTFTNVNTATYAAAVINNGVTTTSGSSYLTAADSASLSPTGNFSMSFWWYPASSSSFAYPPHKWNANGSNNRSWIIQAKQSTGQFMLYVSSDGSNNGSASVTATITDSVWQHYVVTYTAASGTLEVWRNGSSAGTDTGTLLTSIFDANGLTQLNANDEGAGRTIGPGGSFDEIGFWKRVLSSTEIASLYNSGAGFAYPFVASSGPANLKTFNGLAKASVKTVNGLAIASVKTINGLA